MISAIRFSRRSLRLLGSPLVLIRLSSLLVSLLLLGHISAYPWTSPAGFQLVASMRSVDFVFFGEHSTYWSLYSGWGLLVGVLLLTLAIVLWALSDLASLAPRRIGVISVAISASCLVGAYLSFRFFYVPPTVFYCVICLMLLAAAVLLLRQDTKAKA